MAKKQTTQAYDPDAVPFDDFSNENLNEDQALDTDVSFDLEDEYKPQPLLVGGTYRANIIAVTAEKSKHCITFKICFDENGSVMNDGKTQVDGAHEIYRVWLPKAGDEHEMESNGRFTKRQGKINRMTDFAKGLGISMRTPDVINQAIQEQLWIGIPVLVTVDSEEYMGVVRNKITRMTLDKTRS